MKEAREHVVATIARLEGSPDHFQVARGCRVLGALRVGQLDFVPAREALDKALDMDAGLLAANPHSLEFRLEHALTLRAIGILHLYRADATSARENLTRARKIALDLAKEHSLPNRNITLDGELASDIASADALAAPSR